MAKRKAKRAENKAWSAISRYCPSWAGKRKKINMKKCRAALSRYAKARKASR